MSKTKKSSSGSKGSSTTKKSTSCFDNALAGVQNVRTQIGEYEEAHSHADMYPIDMMVGYLRSIIGGQLGGSSATISAYDASVVNTTESFQLAQMMDGMLSTYLEQVKDRVNSCEEFYELQQQQWQESIRLRTEEGIVKTIAGVGTMILGGMLVVATCGMALPLVTTVGVVAIGLGTTAYGCANAIEGSQDVYAGVTGDPRMVSVNPIRDTLFASNPDLYYLIGNTLTISASLLLTGGMAANAAVSAGTSIGRAVVTEYAKQGLTMAASSYVDKRMTEATNSPLAGFVVGSLTGMATYGTLSEAELEVVNNVKRPQQLGNVGESGRNIKATFASEEKLLSHFEKHGGEFKGIFNSAEEYLRGAQDVMQNGYKVEYAYKGETRTGYVQFMGNNSKGNAKFAFVGTNNEGYITTFHTESGKTFWKMLNGVNIPVINPK